MVDEGLTEKLPELGEPPELTYPTLLMYTQVSALADVQVRVEVSPWLTALGERETEQVGGELIIPNQTEYGVVYPVEEINLVPSEDESIDAQYCVPAEDSCTQVAPPSDDI